MRVYHKEEQFECSIFGKIFGNSSTCNNHTGEKPPECYFCDKKFSPRAILTCHMRIHSGTEPYLCSVCGRKFNIYANLSAHMTRLDGEKPCACPVCGRKFRRIGDTVS